VVEPSAWACGKEKKQEKQQLQLFFYFGSLKMKLPKNRIFNIFQI
jgi:hypothetical protein